MSKRPKNYENRRKGAKTVLGKGAKTSRESFRRAREAKINELWVPQESSLGELVRRGSVTSCGSHKSPLSESSLGKDLSRVVGPA